MERSGLSVSIASSSVDIVEHNIWTPMMELLFRVQISGTLEPLMEETGLPRIALSCHLALDLLFNKAGPTILLNALSGIIASDESFFYMAPLPLLGHRRVERSWRRAAQTLLSKYP